MASSPYHRKPEDSALASLGDRVLAESVAGVRKQPRGAKCASCDLPFTQHRPPVLLKTGQRIRVDCYFSLQRIPRQQVS
jgi:hypothetical protein